MALPIRLSQRSTAFRGSLGKVRASRSHEKALRTLGGALPLDSSGHS